jgi:hypothetical protein
MSVFHAVPGDTLKVGILGGLTGIGIVETIDNER